MLHKDKINIYFGFILLTDLPAGTELGELDVLSLVGLKIISRTDSLGVRVSFTLFLPGHKFKSPGKKSFGCF
mgnify:FL=1